MRAARTLANACRCGSLLEDAAARVAENEITPAMHRFAAALFLDPETARRTLAQPLALRKRHKDSVSTVSVSALRLELLAAHALVPKLRATDETERLFAPRTVDLAIVSLPRKHEATARRRTAPEVIALVDAPLQNEALVALAATARAESALHIPRQQCHAALLRLDARARQLIAHHLARLNLALHKVRDALDTERVVARPEGRCLCRRGVAKANWAGNFAGGSLPWRQNVC